MDKLILDTIISENIKKAIIASSKSKSQIAAEIEVSRPTLSQYLSGKIQPRLPTFAKLAIALDIESDVLLGIK